MAAMEQCLPTKSCYHCSHIGNNSGNSNHFYCDLDMDLDILLLDPPLHDQFRNYECPKKVFNIKEG